VKWFDKIERGLISDFSLTRKIARDDLVEILIASNRPT